MNPRTRLARLGFMAVVAALAACADLGGPIDPSGTVDPPEFHSVSPTTAGVALQPGETVTFEVAALSPAELPLEYEFRLDGTSVSTATRWSFQPAAPGTYRVEAVASDGTQQITRTWLVDVRDVQSVNLPPTAVLALDPATGPAPLSVRVRLSGADPDGTLVLYRIQLAGAGSLEITRTAAIDTTLTLPAGTYTVQGTVVDDDGAVAISSGTIQAAAPPANRAPAAGLAVTPATGTAPLDVRVDAAGSDPDGTVVLYELDLDGDGAWDVTAGAPLTRSIHLAGTADFWVRLQVTDDGGATARDSVRVTVAPPPGGNQAPTLELALDRTSGPAPLAVRATATGADPDGQVVSMTIDFDGDGQPDAAGGPPVLTGDFTFATAGTYTVRATVTDDGGRATTRSATVTVTATGPNAPPAGSLSASATRGDADLTVELSAAGTDADGEIVKWEIDADQGQGFVELGPSRRLTVAYGFRESAWRPRLRLTDDGGAVTVVDGPEVLVYRPISPTRSGGTATGNPRFAEVQIAPAIWADGEDVMRFTVTVLGPDGAPLADVPVRVRSLRPELVSPTGTALGGTITISLDGTRTDGSGRLTGAFTTRTSSRVWGAPTVGAFVAFGLMLEADAGHGEWRRLPDIEGLNAETTVSNDYFVGRVFVDPPSVTCVGEPVEIHVQALRRFDAPMPGTPASGMYTEIRYATGGQALPVTPLPDYEDWRTDAGGWIKFRFVPTESSFKTLAGWVDGQPLNIPAALAVGDC